MVFARTVNAETELKTGMKILQNVSHIFTLKNEVVIGPITFLILTILEEYTEWVVFQRFLDVRA